MNLFKRIKFYFLANKYLATVILLIGLVGVISLLSALPIYFENGIPKWRIESNEEDNSIQIDTNTQTESETETATEFVAPRCADKHPGIYYYPPKKTLVYYGYPSSITQASVDFYDAIVLGDVLTTDPDTGEDHPDFIYTRTLIQNNPGTEFFLYIDSVGDSTSPIGRTDKVEILARALTLNPKGIFLDNFGKDFLASRIDQQIWIDSVLGAFDLVMINLWNTSELEDLSMDKRVIYTFESLGVQESGYIDPRSRTSSVYQEDYSSLGTRTLPCSFMSLTTVLPGVSVETQNYEVSFVHSLIQGARYFSIGERNFYADPSPPSTEPNRTLISSLYTKFLGASDPDPEKVFYGAEVNELTSNVNEVYIKTNYSLKKILLNFASGELDSVKTTSCEDPEEEDLTWLNWILKWIWEPILNFFRMIGSGISWIWNLIAWAFSFVVNVFRDWVIDPILSWISWATGLGENAMSFVSSVFKNVLLWGILVIAIAKYQTLYSAMGGYSFIAIIGYAMILILTYVTEVSSLGPLGTLATVIALTFLVSLIGLNNIPKKWTL